MKTLNFLAIVLFMLCGFQTLQAQTETNDEDDGLSLDNSTINNQFEYVLKRKKLSY